MNPKLRPLEMQLVRQGGEQFLMLRDPLGLSDKALLVPPALGLMLPLCDGTRDPATLRAGFELRSGLRITPQQVDQIIDHLDNALLLSSPRFERAIAQALKDFREAPFRSPALAGAGYPAEGHALRALFDDYVADSAAVQSDGITIRGLISPHIDYHRGGPIYARVWTAAAPALRHAELVIILGTDHAGELGSLTLTRQSYATPWGVLPTAIDVVDELAEALGHEAFKLELNHRREHSIELATVWLHYVLGDRTCPVVPVLCGSFEHFVKGLAEPTEDAAMAGAIEVLARACRKRRAVVVAAADLAHVGPAFGDSAPFGAADRATLAGADHELLATASAGNAAQFLSLLRRDGDARRICGLPPIYLMLRLLEGTRGVVLDYLQCQADADGGSWVTVSGVAYHK